MIYSSTKLRTLQTQTKLLMEKRDQITIAVQNSSTAPYKIQELEQCYVEITDQLTSLAEQYDKEMLDIAAKTNTTVSGLLKRKENLETQKDTLEKTYSLLIVRVSTPLKFKLAAETPIFHEIGNIRETLAGISKELVAIKAELKAAMDEEAGNASIIGTSDNNQAIYNQFLDSFGNF